MTGAELTERLTALVEEQAGIIRSLAMELAQYETAAEIERRLEEVRRMRKDVLGE